MNAFEEWAVRSNLQRIAEEGLDPAQVVATIRANGYPTIAEAVERATQGQ